MPHLTFVQNLWALFGGLITGGLFTLVGGGGSGMAVPLLTTVVGLERVKVAMGTTAVSVAATALMSAWLKARRGQIDWQAALAFTIPGFAGVLLGSHLVNDFPSHLLLTGLGIIMLFNASLMVALSNDSHPQPHTRLQRFPHWTRLLPSGLGVGVLAGLFGMGGGFLALPSMVLGGVSFNAAVGSSVISVGTLNVVSAVAYAFKGLVDWHVVIDYVSGGLFGSFVAMPLSQRLAARRRLTSLALAVMLTAISLYLIANNVRALYSNHPLV